MIADDFIHRYRHKYFGKYRGIVADINDTRERGRIKLTVASVHGTDFITDESPWTGWAEAAIGGAVSGGMFRMPNVGDMVWVEFEEGDKERPIWMHGWWTLDTAPKAGVGRYDASDLTLSSDSSPTKNDAEYGDTQVWETKAGKIQFDSTESNTKIQIFHKASGTRIEIYSDGTIKQEAIGNYSTITRGSKVETVSSGLTLNVGGATKETYAARTISEDGLAYTNTSAAEYNYTGGKTEYIGTDILPDNPNVIGHSGKYTISSGSRKIITSGLDDHSIGGNLEVCVAGGETRLIGGKIGGDLNPINMALPGSAYKVMAQDPATQQINFLVGPLPWDLGQPGYPLAMDKNLPGVLYGSLSGINLVHSIDPSMVAASAVHVGTTAVLLQHTTAQVAVRLPGTFITNLLTPPGLAPEPVVKISAFVAWAASVNIALTALGQAAPAGAFATAAPLLPSTSLFVQ